MKDFRVLITEKCNADCPSCFNKIIRQGHEMALSDFIKICEYLKEEGRITTLKIMGGEPTVHPNFADIVRNAQSYFESVHIFTNAINNAIETIELRKKDSVIYNVSCLPISPVPSRFILDQIGGRMFETQISSECNVEIIKKKLYNLRQIIPDDRMAIALTLNCIEDIFKNRHLIIQKWNDIAQFIKNDLGIIHNVDHNIPYCFFIGSNMDIHVSKSLCNLKCAGLITPSLKLQYCNQSPEILSDIINNNAFIPFEIIENRLSEYYHAKMHHNLKKICRNCILFEKKCNGGCFMHKDIISLQSIIDNSDMPFA